GRDLFPWPAVRLLEKLEFVIVDSKGTQLWTGEVENLMPSGRSVAEQKVHLVVAVEEVLVTIVAQLHPFEGLNLVVGGDGVSCEGGEPVETGKDAVLNRAGFNLARPADNARHAETALKTCAFGGLKRCHPAIRPGEYFRSVVGGEDNDRVVGLAN